MPTASASVTFLPSSSITEWLWSQTDLSFNFSSITCYFRLVNYLKQSLLSPPLTRGNNTYWRDCRACPFLSSPSALTPTTQPTWVHCFSPSLAFPSLCFSVNSFRLQRSFLNLYKPDPVFMTPLSNQLSKPATWISSHFCGFHTSLLINRQCPQVLPAQSLSSPSTSSNVLNSRKSFSSSKT